MLKTTAIGHLGKDCVVNDVNGKGVINFSIAHSEKYKDAQGTQHEKTTWVECSLWRDSVSIAPYLKKGQQVYVEGQPEIRTYQKQDGSFGATFRLRVSQIQLLGGNPNQQSTPPPSQPQQASTNQFWGKQDSESVDDLPF
ncbi:single-stranded DNA-binding protein [Niabella sp. CJ426]|uniref:single-stranded DNA-binding protein n=1 Tax=Niabella sp. CJ426 TaxID=3393740 RepID=UPI003D06C696